MQITRELERTVKTDYLETTNDADISERIAIGLLNFQKNYKENLEIYNSGTKADLYAKGLLFICFPIALAHAIIFPELYHQQKQ